MNEPQRPRHMTIVFRALPTSRVWLVVLAVIIALAIHLGVLRYALLHSGLSAGVAIGIVVLIVVKHLGLLGSLYGVIRRRHRL